MTRIVLIVLIYIISFPFGFAQSDVATLELKGSKPLDAYAANDTYGNIAYIFQFSKTYQVTIIDATYRMKNIFTIPREGDDKKNIVIGATLSEKNFTVYMHSPKHKTFTSLVVDRFKGTYTYNNIGSVEPDLNYLKAFDMEGAFYLMLVPTHKNSITVLSTKEGVPFETTNYEIDFPTLYAKLSGKNDDLNQKTDTPVGIEYISYTRENNIKSAYPTKKMFTYGNKIYMTFDEPQTTHLVIIDPTIKKSTYRKLNFSLDKGEIVKQGNSFLNKGGDLFRTTLGVNQMNISVINLDSMELLKAYNLYPDKDIEILNGIIKEDGNDIGEKVIKSSQQYFKKLHKGKLAIAVNNLNDGRYEAEVGAYEEVIITRGGNGNGFGSPGLSIGMGMGTGMGMGGMGMGGMGMGYGGMGMGYGGFGSPYGYGGYPGYYGNNNNYTSSSVRIIYFQTLLKYEDLSHLDGNVPKTLREKINEYEEKVFKGNEPEILNITPCYNGLVLGYYAKHKHSFQLVEIKR